MINWNRTLSFNNTEELKFTQRLTKYPDEVIQESDNPLTQTKFFT
jgi:hypothetical protein